MNDTCLLLFFDDRFAHTIRSSSDSQTSSGKYYIQVHTLHHLAGAKP